MKPFVRYIHSKCWKKVGLGKAQAHFVILSIVEPLKLNMDYYLLKTRDNYGSDEWNEFQEPVECATRRITAGMLGLISCHKCGGVQKQKTEPFRIKQINSEKENSSFSKLIRFAVCDANI